MEHLRILFNYIGRTGGGASYSYEMAKGLIENGALVTAIIPEGISNVEKWKALDFERLILIKTYSDKTSFILNSIKFALIDRWKLKNELGKKPFDFCYVPMVQLWTFLVNRLVKGTKLIVTLHDPVPHSGSSKLIEYFTVNKWVASKADKLIILTEKFKQDVCRIYHKNDNDVAVIPHGIFDYSQYDNGHRIERTSEFNFLFFGRVEKYKGIELLIKAYSRLEKENKGVSLYIVGKGNIDEYRNELSLCQRITVVNRFVDDSEVLSFFRGKNIITVLPYIDATQSGVAPIAMKEEALLIVTNTGGLSEQTHNGEFALLCEPNEESLYETMKYAVTNYNDCHKIVRAAKEYADGLSWNYLAKRVIDFGRN